MLANEVSASTRVVPLTTNGAAVVPMSAARAVRLTTAPVTSIAEPAPAISVLSVALVRYCV